MIDLNSRSQLADRVNWHLDRALVAEEDGHAPRDYLGGSIIGDPCERAVQLHFLHVPPDDGRVIDGRMLRIFERGRWAEAAGARWLRLAGFTLLTEDQALGGQFEVTALDGRLKGHADGILAFFRGGQAPIPLPSLWECKCLGAKYWRATVKEKLRRSHPRYFAQMQVYMAGLGLTQGLVTAVNADTMELYHEPVPFDPEAHEALIQRAGRILTACDLGEELPRMPGGETSVVCRMCAWWGRCWRPA